MFDFLLRHSPLLYLTQSLWRDEAFSILVAERPLASVLGKLSFEPPVYYILLHFWIKLFGASEVAARSLSFMGFALATVVVIYWAEKLFPKHWLSWFLPLFFFLNPMLLYYAFEVRTYGWYIFFATLSIYSYMEKRWRLYMVATLLCFYTHTFAIFIPLAQAFHYFLAHQKLFFPPTPTKILHNPMVRSLLIIGLGIAPWLIRIGMEMGKLKSSWYFPVDFHLVQSVLGNLFIGYEGTPWYLWQDTAALSLVLLGVFIFALKKEETRVRNGFFATLIFLPLAIVLGVSVAKPLFVNRYLIFVAIAEVFLVSLAISAIVDKRVQKLVGALILIFVLATNVWYPDKHAKLDIRNTIQQVNNLVGTNDVMFVDSPLVFFETIYYSKNPNRVFLYNPTGGAFPWYVGDIIVTPSQMVRDLPPYPMRAFMIHVDGTFDIAYTTALPTKPPAQSRARL